jgi:hypothetical protein
MSEVCRKYLMELMGDREWLELESRRRCWAVWSNRCPPGVPTSNSLYLEERK